MKTYKYEDFITGEEWNVPAKIDFYNMVVPQHGGWKTVKGIKDQFFKTYRDELVARSRWKSWRLTGSREALSKLTGYPKNSRECKALHQTVVEQFKNKLDEIYEGYGKYQVNENCLFEVKSQQIDDVEENNTQTTFTQLKELIQVLEKVKVDEVKSMEMIKAFMCAS